ncbi:Uncharacterised protein [Kingella potus]|uniref:DUF4272 domain-containing protein n=1 Tax=Kingella potus TaxID=265175 RepID=A0A377QZ41_9NEIS|nr:DUF4272 domain-containing protein [Kingella potus]UOP01647.1 DUF4272 domain-containing protein [Kingella potus]STR00055.1 Uncharacterised protein [Kingella potus]
MKSAIQRRAENNAKLQARGIHCFPELPYLNEQNEVKIRSAREIATRAVASLLTTVAALEQEHGNYAKEREFIQNKINDFGVQAALTPAERTVIAGEADAQERINAVWKYEAYWTLVWALGFVDELDFPDHIVDGPTAIGIMAQFADLDEMVAAAKLRDVGEILDEADLIYRYHWACVDARVNGSGPLQGLESSVVVERRVGLWWMLDIDGQDDWDDVAMDT